MKVSKEIYQNFEQVLLTLFWIENKVFTTKITLIFGYKTSSIVSNTINHWMPIFGEVGKHLSILPFVDKITIDELKTQSYIDLGLRLIALVVDGKDFNTQTVQNNCSTISTVKQGNKLKEEYIHILTWSLPSELNVEHTNGFFAQTAEKNINFVWCRYGRLIIPIGYVVSGNKVLYGTSGLYVNFNPKLSSSFLYGNSQFSPQ